MFVLQKNKLNTMWVDLCFIVSFLCSIDCDTCKIGIKGIDTNLATAIRIASLVNSMGDCIFQE
ncbi:hypothetical protein CS542_03365 [Pedobacter sp. IW39]|nr:hypothetical protein CS542_03365 [Pedobacter sp. IW39]